MELPTGLLLPAQRRTATAVRFSTVDEMAPAIAGAQVRLVQAGAGTGGCLRSISLGDTAVQLGRYDATVLTRGTLNANRVGMLIPLAPRPTGTWEGQPSEAGTALVYAPGAQAFAHDREGTVWARITVAAERLGRAFLASTGRELELPDASFRRLRPAPGSLERLKQRLRDLPRSIGACAAAPQPSQRRLEAQLLSELCHALGSAGTAWSHPAEGSDPRRIVLAVEKHLEQEMHERVRLADLSAAAGASERTVEHAFRRILATPPMRYVKLLRLARVHQGLRASGPGSTTVTTLAMDWGFKHLSLFAQDYRNVYGEAPSTTLRRACAHR